MRGIALCLFVVAAFDLSAGKRKDCKSVDPMELLLPHPTDCSAYYQFLPKYKRCPKGFMFDSVHQMCDHPENVECHCGDIGKTSTRGKTGGLRNVYRGNCLSRGKCPAVDPSDHTVLLPHLKECNLYCRCDHGIPILQKCPKGLYFNPKLKTCDWPASAGCVLGLCDLLVLDDRSHWEPKKCSGDVTALNDVCNLQCKEGFELRGSSKITCTEDGWNSTHGMNQIPGCYTIEELADNLADNINDTLTQVTNLLFLVDESGSLGSVNFDMELKFVKSLVKSFPLSVNRSAGVITFSSEADIKINLQESNTCNFLENIGKITYNPGDSDILNALNMAVTEIGRNSPNVATLVFLITDGVSETNPTSAANNIKKEKNVLFSVGVGGYDPKQLVPLSSIDDKGAPLFYGIRNFQVFDAVANYLETRYNGTSSANCP